MCSLGMPGNWGIAHVTCLFAYRVLFIWQRTG
jgi:hypothetical protein